MKVQKVWRTPAIAAVLLVAATSLAACGSSDDSDASNNPDTQKGAGEGKVEDPTSPVEITFFSWVGQEDTMQKFAADFHKLHPNITIKFENVPAEQAGAKLTTQIAGNNAPDVAYVNASDTSDYASRGALVDLTDYISRSDIVDPDDYTDAFKTFVTYEDKLWGLPMDGESTGLFYRTDLFEQAGITEPPKTWDEFEQDAAALTDESKGQYGYVNWAAEAGYYWYPWLYQAGGDVMSADGQEIAFTSDEAKKAADFYVGLTKYSPPGELGSNSYDSRVAFSEGKIGMYMAGAWLAGVLDDEFPDIKGKWSTAPLPEGDAGCKTTIAGDSLVMFSQVDDDKADAAWLWMEYLSQPDILADWTYRTEGTLLPPLKSLLDGEEIVEKKPVLKGFIDLMQCGVASTVSNPKTPRIETVLNEELGKAMYGDQTAEQALDNAAGRAQAILSR